VEFGIGDVPAEGGFDIGEEIAFAHGVAHAHGAGVNSELAELSAEPPFVDFASATQIFPWAIVPRVQQVDDLTT
jgi:hypothetical protein